MDIQIPHFLSTKVSGLEEQLNFNKGEQVLVVNQILYNPFEEKNNNGEKFLPSKTNQLTKYVLCLGILNSEGRIYFDNENVSNFYIEGINFPVGQYVTKIGGGEWRLNQRFISIQGKNISNLIFDDEDPFNRMISHNEHKNKISVSFGEDVTKHFIYWNGKPDLNYVIAMNLLGDKISDNYKDLFEKALDQKSRDIYEVLSNFERSKGEDNGKIREILKEANSLGLNRRKYKFNPTPAITVDFPLYLEDIKKQLVIT